MIFFNKVLVQDKETGGLIDITELDKKEYENFLDAMEVLKAVYEQEINKLDVN